jgi:hypothetical protein
MMKEMWMRFMMVVIRKGFETAAADAAPGAEAVARMMEYNKSLQKAGVRLGLDGLFPPSTGALVSYADGTATVTDRPFAEAKEAIGGYWIIHAFAGRGARMGQASTDGQQRDHRSAPNLREGRFLHSRSERSRAESSRRLRGAFERGCGKGASDIQA